MAVPWQDSSQDDLYKIIFIINSIICKLRRAGMEGGALELEGILDALLDRARHPDTEPASLPYPHLLQHYIIHPTDMSQLQTMHLSIPSSIPCLPQVQQQQQQQRGQKPLPDVIKSSISRPTCLPDIIEGVEASKTPVKAVARTRRKLSRNKCCTKSKVKCDLTKDNVDTPDVDDTEQSNEETHHERLQEEQVPKPNLSSRSGFRLRGMFQEEILDGHQHHDGFRQAGACLRAIADAFHDADDDDNAAEGHQDRRQDHRRGQRMLTAFLRSRGLENALMEAVAERPLLFGLVLITYFFFADSGS